MFHDTFLNIYTTGQTKMPTLPSNTAMESKEISRYIIIHNQMVKDEMILTENVVSQALSCW